MKIAIFGYSGSGKTELFNSLAGPHNTQTNRAIVKVPEPRLIPLAQLFNSKRTIYPEVEYADIQGGSGKGLGLGQKVANAIRPYNCLLAVLDCFSGLVDPKNQWQNIEADLIISDLDVVERRLEKISIDKKKGKNLVDAHEEELLHQVKSFLDTEKPLRRNKSLIQAPELRSFSFLTAKPILYVWNVSENALEIQNPIEDIPGETHTTICAKLERELAELEGPKDKEEFLYEMGLQQSAVDKIIAKTYELLGLITFITVGEKEVKAWPIPMGTTAYEAAGEIHSDMQRGFIRAEVLSWADFQKYKSFKTAREKGALRLEGKDYVIQDGDIVTIRFNV